MKYDPCGALQYVDASVDTTSGLYSTDGLCRMYGAASGSGTYTPDGAYRVNVVDGNSLVGAYDATGALNVFIVDGSVQVGLYAACGALNIIAP